MEKQRDRLPQTRAKGEDEMNNTIKTLQHKENKLAGVLRNWQCCVPALAPFGIRLSTALAAACTSRPRSTRRWCASSCCHSKTLLVLDEKQILTHVPCM